MKEHGIAPIDLVVVNLYPFEATVARGASFDEIVENIDIGGPSMVRAAAKNYQHVGVIVDPEDYSSILAELRQNGCSLSPATHFRLFCKAFQHTSHYDGAISNYFSSLDENKKPTPWGQTVNIQSPRFRTCATARTRIKEPLFTPRRGRPVLPFARQTVSRQRAVLQQYIGCRRGVKHRPGILRHRSGSHQA